MGDITEKAKKKVENVPPICKILINAPITVNTEEIANV